jgi:hypothetical protein
MQEPISNVKEEEYEVFPYNESQGKVIKNYS